MAGRATKPIRPAAVVQAPKVEDTTTQRALDVLTGAVNEMKSTRSRDVLNASLVVGTNKIQHSLGRACSGYTLTPTTADATFAHALDRSNPQPDREVWIIVIGVAQSDATIEVF